jgi:hypothetical protein
MDFFQFYLFYMHNIERDDPLEQVPYSVSSYDRLGKRGGKWSAKTSLLDLLCATRHCGAKDARDKYFALISMLSDRGTEHLMADYSKDVLEVYTDVAVYILKNVGLKVLCGANGPSAIPNLPTWVPDWTIDSGRTCSVLLDGFMLGWRCDGSPDLDAKITQYVEGRLVSELRLTGAKIGSVTELGIPYNRHQSKLEESVRNWEEFYYAREHAAPIKEGDFNLQSFFRTIGFAYAFWPRDEVSYSPINNGKAIFRVTTPGLPENSRVEGDEASIDYRSRQYSRKTQEAMHKRRFFRISGVCCGMGPEEARIGDILCVFLGAPVPFLVRRRAEHDILVGECYVDGMMGGEKIPEEFDPKFPETYGDLVLEQFILR